MKKIGLIGSAPSSVRLAPYANKDWEIWGCSPGAYGVVPRSDVWFELHRWEPGQPWFSPEYVSFLKNYPGPVWMAEHVPEVKNCCVVPVKELVEKYSPYFFTSSLSWMFAMAIEMNPKSIGLWGVDMSATEEYAWQRPGCHFFALLAKAKGIEVGVSPESDLLRPPPLYGICETSHAWIKNLSRTRELNDRINAAQMKLSQATQEIQFLSGCKDDMNWQMNTWFGNVDFLGRAYIEPTETPALKELAQGPVQIDNVTKLYDDIIG